MKKMFFGLLASIMILSLAACGGAPKELTKINEILDLETGKILVVGGNQKKAAVEKILGEGTPKENTATVHGESFSYRDGTVTVIYDENEVLQSVRYFDADAFETTKYKPGITMEALKEQLQLAHEDETGETMCSGRYDLKGEPVGGDSPEEINVIFIYKDREFSLYQLSNGVFLREEQEAKAA